jgi:hypothetical protein
MANLIRGHNFSDFAARSIGRTGDNLGRHNLGYSGSLNVHRGGNHSVDNIPLCHDANKVSVVIIYDKATDFISEHFDRGCFDSGIMADSYNFCGSFNDSVHLLVLWMIHY